MAVLRAGTLLKGRTLTLRDLVLTPGGHQLRVCSASRVRSPIIQWPHC